MLIKLLTSSWLNSFKPFVSRNHQRLAGEASERPACETKVQGHIQMWAVQGHSKLEVVERRKRAHSFWQGGNHQRWTRHDAHHQQLPAWRRLRLHLGSGGSQIHSQTHTRRFVALENLEDCVRKFKKWLSVDFSACCFRTWGWNPEASLQRGGGREGGSQLWHWNIRGRCSWRMETEGPGVDEISGKTFKNTWSITAAQKCYQIARQRKSCKVWEKDNQENVATGLFC